MAEPFDPEAAVDAGFLDRVADPSELSSVVGAIADQLTRLDLDADRATKQRVRKAALQAVHEAIEADTIDYREQKRLNSVTAS